MSATSFAPKIPALDYPHPAAKKEPRDACAFELALVSSLNCPVFNHRPPPPPFSPLPHRCPTLPATILGMKLKFMQPVPIQVPDHQFTLQAHQVQQRPPNDALQLKAAEYWLKLGEADQALRELEKWLGAQDPDCCNGGVEGTRRNDGPSLMKRKSEYFPPFKDEGDVTASWGEARLIKYLDGKLVLKGGSKEDRMAAREWISMFRPA